MDELTRIADDIERRMSNLADPAMPADPAKPAEGEEKPMETEEEEAKTNAAAPSAEGDKSAD